jgi:deazaflavin-dependent oxidoreductase (nitroreductase family)
VLTTLGRKTGAQMINPLGWFPGDHGSYLIVVSAAGAARNPAWYHNLAAHPDQMSIETTGTKLAVTAEKLHRPAREVARQQIMTASPRYGPYQVKTDRRIPVIRPTPSQGDVRSV